MRQTFTLRHGQRCAALIISLLMTTLANAQLLSFRTILDRPDRPTPNHKIAYGDHADQYGELWLPAATPSLTPVVVLIHGGCWRADLPGPELVAFLADSLRSNGLAVWSVTYRRVGTRAKNFSPYPDTFRDVMAATEKLRALAAQHRLDLARVVTTGHSAGGHLAMWLAARPKLPTDSPLFARSPLPIHATVGIAAIPDLEYARTATAHACGNDTIDLLIDYKTRNPAAYRDTSVAALLPLGVRQVLISGTQDPIVTPLHAKRHQLQAKGEAVELLTLDHAGHFELIAPWTPAGKTVVQRIVEATRL